MRIVRVKLHRDAMRGIKPENVQPELYMGAQTAWDDALELGEKYGYKNSQVTVLAPTGTISFNIDGDLMDIAASLLGAIVVLISGSIWRRRKLQSQAHEAPASA